MPKDQQSPSGNATAVDYSRTSNSLLEDNADENIFDNTYSSTSSNSENDQDQESSNASDDGDDASSESSNEEGDIDGVSTITGKLLQEKKPDVLNVLMKRLAANDPNLRDLEIDVHTLRRNSAADIAKGLRKSLYLCKLCLRLDKIGSPDIKTLLLGGIEHNTSITSLDILHCQEMDRAVATALGTALAHNKTLKRLCLSSCNFTGSGLAVLFIGMQHHNPSIQHLAVSSCKLGGYAADVVSASLPLMKQLKSLRLQNVGMTLDGLRFLFENVHNSSSLTVLDLSQNILDVEAIQLLVACLRSSQEYKQRQQVQRLVLSACGLDRTCVEVLSKGLIAQHNSTLEQIDLSHNGSLGDPAALRLKRLLDQNNKIKELHLDGCNISQELLRTIHDGLRYNNSFLKNVFSTEVSLAILDSVSLIEDASGSFS
jgi:Ran GTPase-activating protein (RanGAP) involved in mRNA processing and transport